MISAIKDVKEHNEGVKSQIKEIKEDINSATMVIISRSSWMSSSSTRDETVWK